MNFKDLLSLIGIALGLASSLFFAKGLLVMRDDEVKKLAVAYHGPNPDIVRSIVVQRTQYVVGAVLLLVSFALQFAAPLIPAEFAVHEIAGKWSCAAFAGAVAVVGVLLGWIWESRRKRRAEGLIRASLH